MKKIIDYTQLISDDIGQLGTGIKDEVHEGWVPFGPITPIYQGEDVVEYMQAMVKEAMPSEYTIVEAFSLEELRKELLRKFRDGWEPVGEIGTGVAEGTTVTYFRELARYKKPYSL